jgi:hypothetical protein
MRCALAGVVLALLPVAATSTTMRVSLVTLHALPSRWAAGVIVVRVRTATGAALAVLDTGGYTETKARHPRNFSTYYRGLPVSRSLGPDYLRSRVVTIGTTRGRQRRRRLRFDRCMERRTHSSRARSAARGIDCSWTRPHSRGRSAMQRMHRLEAWCSSDRPLFRGLVAIAEC